VLTPNDGVPDSRRDTENALWDFQQIEQLIKVPGSKEPSTLPFQSFYNAGVDYIDLGRLPFATFQKIASTCRGGCSSSGTHLRRKLKKLKLKP
jgi:hypothetical protein